PVFTTGGGQAAQPVIVAVKSQLEVGDLTAQLFLQGLACTNFLFKRGRHNSVGAGGRALPCVRCVQCLGLGGCSVVRNSTGGGIARQVGRPQLFTIVGPEEISSGQQRDNNHQPGKR